MKVSDVHRQLIGHLRSDSRKSFSSISRETGIPVTTLFDNYGKLYEQGIIAKHASLIDFPKLGYNYRSLIMMSAAHKDELKSFLMEHPNVNSVYKVTGYDFLADCVFRGMKEYYAFLESCSDFGISKLEPHDVVEHVKQEGVMQHIPSEVDKFIHPEFY